MNEQKTVIDMKPVTTYFEKKDNKTLYCVTNVYQGKFDLATALEELTVRKILRIENLTPSA